jgi:preprotein translocase subunit SecF
LSEDNTGNSGKPKSSSKDTLWIAGAFLLMIAAIFTIWQVLLKGKYEEESKQKDTVVQVRTDTVKIKDSIAEQKKRSTQTQIQSTEYTTNSTSEKKDTSTIRNVVKNLDDDKKEDLKKKVSELPKKKQDKIRKKLKSELKK